MVSSSICDQTCTLYIRTIKEDCSMTQRQATWGQPLPSTDLDHIFGMFFRNCAWDSKHRTPFVALIANNLCSIEIDKIIQEHKPFIKLSY